MRMIHTYTSRTSPSPTHQPITHPYHAQSPPLREPQGHFSHKQTYSTHAFAYLQRPACKPSRTIGLRHLLPEGCAKVSKRGSAYFYMPCMSAEGRITRQRGWDD